MDDLEARSASLSIPSSYPPLLTPGQQAPDEAAKRKRAWLPCLSAGVAALLLLSLVALLSNGTINFAPDNGAGHEQDRRSHPMPRGPAEGVPQKTKAWDPESLEGIMRELKYGPRIPMDLWRRPLSRGQANGVSEKTTAWDLKSAPKFNWTGTMLTWQRTAFHFQPQKNWMNDPNGPLYYKGWYHFFYQYNPDAAVWGNITWGHAVSKDLIHWLYLPLAMVPDHWYDANGVWTGSATFLHDGRLAMLYTGATPEMVQVQNLAYPADPNDPLLLKWTKSDANPILVPPPGIGTKDFRDPTTAWYVPSQATWMLAIGSKNDTSGKHAGITLIYKTKDFINYELLPGVLHEVPRTGMWECVDFYPVATEGTAGLDTSEPAGPGVKHVLKASMDDDRHDYYAIGTYELEKNLWTPDDPEMDVGIGLRYDYGKFYASKTFYDQTKHRRILWSWVGETDSERTDIKKGWSSLQAIPRTILFDPKTGSNLLQWPVEEVEKLRMGARTFTDVPIDAGTVVPLDIGRATQMDIVAEFTFEETALSTLFEADVGYNCSTSDGAAGRGALGPFGLLVLADEDLSEQTAVYFYVSRTTAGDFTTHFCHDELRSSKANDIVKRIYGSLVPVVEGETLTIRILVDHSIVESFAQGGRTCITSRIYPTKALYGAARLFLFNNATDLRITAKSVKVWQMDSAHIHDYKGDEDDALASTSHALFPTRFHHPTTVDLDHRGVGKGRTEPGRARA